ncbi:Alpha/Beta hydrolase protein [Cadophora sp. MPI-SDFR-AT-0126]|nr:Alpha/Beta hydrolase protein [Leotiomycetes sp. MPI-SDFR-AT-0126]
MHLNSPSQIALLAPLFLLSLTACVSATANLTAPPTVKVLNGSYYGTHLESYNQDLFLGIPFAEAPVGELRFANPVGLEGRSWEGAVSATNYAFHCIGYGADQIGYQQSEDCLYLNVVRPTGYENESLPVALWIHGGGFAYGGAPDRRYNLSFIVQNSVDIGKPIIAASIAYRLGPFGFLNGDAVSDAGALNLGLKDQRLALHWINENIAAFGGDKEKVTIWGESAGAASVGLHLTAFNGRDDKLFRAAIMESGGPIFFGEQQNSTDYQPMYDAVVEQAGCGNATDSLTCLREVPFTVLNSVLNTTEFNTPGWWPALDGDFVARYGSEQLNDGSFVHVPIIAGANSDEGTGFSPRGVQTEGDLEDLLIHKIKGSWSASEPVLSSIIEAYIHTNAPDYLIPSTETLGADLSFANTSFGAYWRRSAAYSGDLFFIASRRHTCAVWSAAGLDAYCYRFNAIPAGIPFPISVTHFQEVAFVFDNLQGLGYAVNPFEGKGESYIKLAELMSKSWASFVADLDPNGWVGRSEEVEEWPSYEAVRDEVEGAWDMVFDANVTSFVESDTFREVGIRIMNENWGVVRR